MINPGRWRSACLLVLSALFVPATVAAQEWNKESIVLRALKPDLSGDLIRFLAANTQPAKLEPVNFEVDRLKTPSEIITRRCGTVRPEYYEEFQRLNGVEIAADRPLGDAVETLRWPSCLYIRPAASGIPAVVGKNDSADKIYTRLTGGVATVKQLEAFFGESESKLTHLQPGDVLTGSHVTSPVQVVPTNMELFRAEFAALVESTPLVDVRARDKLIGQIVLPVESRAGGVASATRDCIDSGAPFDAAMVQAALYFSRARQEELGVFPGQPDVFIVDNGFRGANLRSGAPDVFAGTPFPAKFFRRNGESTIARKIVIGKAYWPITSALAATPSMQGHGTHVLGLALGGPGFAEVRRTSGNINTWSQITVLNVSDGEQALADGAVEVLRGVLGVPEDNRIVNMSISFDGNVSPDIATAFDGMVANGSKTLFVVAAGNQARSVSGDIYPAALGALQSKNVVTVAALGGDGRLAPFSNFGPKTVDIAAPGCRIRSWLDASLSETPLSGTSQATPLVTFAASLIRSLIPRTGPSALKTRLVVSGDLMKSDDDGKTAYRVALNIPKALYVFQDYVAVRGAAGAQYLGKVTRLSGVRCAADPANALKGADAVWSLKRRGGQLWLFAGRNTGAQGQVEEPCLATELAGAKLRIVPEFRVDGARFDAIAAAEEMEFPLADIGELVMRPRATE